MSSDPVPVVPLPVVLGAFMVILDQSEVLPKLMAVFSVGGNKIEWAAAGCLLGSGVMPLTGYLGDRVNIRKMYVLARGTGAFHDAGQRRLTAYGDRTAGVGLLYRLALRQAAALGFDDAFLAASW